MYLPRPVFLTFNCQLSATSVADSKDYQLFSCKGALFGKGFLTHLHIWHLITLPEVKTKLSITSPLQSRLHVQIPTGHYPTSGTVRYLGKGKPSLPCSPSRYGGLHSPLQQCSEAQGFIFNQLFLVQKLVQNNRLFFPGYFYTI